MPFRGSTPGTDRPVRRQKTYSQTLRSPCTVTLRKKGNKEVDTFCQLFNERGSTGSDPSVGVAEEAKGTWMRLWTIVDLSPGDTAEVSGVRYRVSNWVYEGTDVCPQIQRVNLTTTETTSVNPDGDPPAGALTIGGVPFLIGGDFVTNETP